MTHYEVLPDWEGAGEYRGSPGAYVRFIARTLPESVSLLMTGNSDGQRSAPAGVVGGGSGPLSAMTITGVDGKRRSLRTFVTEPIFPGEACETYTTGGGGWGDALRRDPARVLDDVRSGFVSAERARDVYGVVLDTGSWKVDATATARRRDELATARAQAGQ